LKKFVSVLAVLLLLSACKSKPISFSEPLHRSLSRPLPFGTNYSKPYYKYYLPPNVGVKSSTEIGSLLSIEQSEIMMNLKVSRVVALSYSDHDLKLEDLMDEKENLFQEGGHYLDVNDQERMFLFTVYEVKKERYLFVLENERVELVSIVDNNNAAYILENMMLILRSIDVNDALIVANYSNKEIVEDKTIHEDFFEHAVPESGNLIEMYNRLHPDDKIEE